MHGIFLPLNNHSLWYLGLGAFSLSLLSYVYFKTKNVRCLYLFLAMVGLGYAIEYCIYVLLESYVYEPRILARDPYYDNNMGAIFSNFLTLPATATFIAAFSLNWMWVPVFAAFVAGIEWLFLDRKSF